MSIHRIIGGNIYIYTISQGLHGVQECKAYRTWSLNDSSADARMSHFQNTITLKLFLKAKGQSVCTFVQES